MATAYHIFQNWKLDQIAHDFISISGDVRSRLQLLTQKEVSNQWWTNIHSVSKLLLLVAGFKTPIQFRIVFQQPQRKHNFTLESFNHPIVWSNTYFTLILLCCKYVSFLSSSPSLSKHLHCIISIVLNVLFSLPMAYVFPFPNHSLHTHTHTQNSHFIAIFIYAIPLYIQHTTPCIFVLLKKTPFIAFKIPLK